MSLSTHVLDATDGTPAVGVRVRLDSRTDEGWQSAAEGVTNADGRIGQFVVDGPDVGVYRLVFDTAAYFGDRPTFYPEVTVTFQIADAAEHYHVPLLLSPFAYSTYRGS